MPIFHHINSVCKSVMMSGLTSIHRPVVSSVQNKLPIVVVLGTTGSGKSKLAIEIAMKYNGEIISADSMQVYKGLDIITNKVTHQERQMVKHHLIDFVDPLKSFTVVDFRNKALKVIDDLLSEGKLPVIVGGTNYYIESLLWNVLVNPEDIPIDSLTVEEDSKYNAKIEESATLNKDLSPDLSSDSDISSSDEAVDDPKKYAELKALNVPSTSDFSPDISNNELHRILATVDPARANQIHPNDRRKILRSLQIYQRYGIPHSEFIKKQKSHPGGSLYGGPLRFSTTCLLWLQCNQEVLNERLDKRVDEMLEAGLIQQMLEFHATYNEHRIRKNLKPDYTQGIFQSIGFKEFHQYLMLSEEERQSDLGQKLLKEGIESMKLVTKRYSKVQLKWITNRFLRETDREIPKIYGLDATDVNKWHECVTLPACEIVSAYVKGEQPSIQPLSLLKKPVNENVSHYCDICEKIIIGSLTWETHLKSRRHYKVKKAKELLKKRQELLSDSQETTAS